MITVYRDSYLLFISRSWWMCCFGYHCNRFFLFDFFTIKLFFCTFSNKVFDLKIYFRRIIVLILKGPNFLMHVFKTYHPKYFLVCSKSNLSTLQGFPPLEKTYFTNISNVTILVWQVGTSIHINWGILIRITSRI